MDDSTVEATAPAPQGNGNVVIEPRGSASERAALSLILPGLGQFAQGRVIAGASQLGTVLAYGALALAAGGGRALFLAIAWNLWSAIDAYRHDRS